MGSFDHILRAKHFFDHCSDNLIGQSGYRSECDLDRDGGVDTTDVTLAGTTYVAALPTGELSTTTVGNIIGWSGYIFDTETQHYCVRFRYFDTNLLRWINRDHAGYVDSMNLYGYGDGRCIGMLDPFGLYGNPSFAAGAHIGANGGFIVYDPAIMRGMGFWEKVAAGHYDHAFRASRWVGYIGLSIFTLPASVLRGAGALAIRLGLNARTTLSSVVYGGDLVGFALPMIAVVRTSQVAWRGGAWMLRVALPWASARLAVGVFVAARWTWGWRGVFSDIIIGMIQGIVNALLPPTATNRHPRFSGGRPARVIARELTETLGSVTGAWQVYEQCRERSVSPIFIFPPIPID